MALEGVFPIDPVRGPATRLRGTTTMRCAALLAAIAACGDNLKAPPEGGPPGPEAGTRALPYHEFPTVPGYTHASETIVAASGPDVVVFAIDQNFPSAGSFELPPSTTFDPPFRRIVYATSHDAGDSFDDPLPLTVAERTDPIVLTAADGSFWATGTNPDPGAAVGTEIYHSVDSGRTFVLAATCAIHDKPWFALDSGRRLIWLAGNIHYDLVGFDGAELAMRSGGQFMSGAYADDDGGHFFSGFQELVWNGSDAPAARGEVLPEGDEARTETIATVSAGKMPDGGEWIVRAMHDSSAGSPIVVRVRHLPDEGLDTALTLPNAVGFLPAAAVDAEGRLHVVWYDSSGPTGRLLYSHSASADLPGRFTVPVVVDDNACPGNGWYPDGQDVASGGRRLREYIGLAITGHRAIISWTHAPTAPSRVRVAHVDF